MPTLRIPARALPWQPFPADLPVVPSPMHSDVPHALRQDPNPAEGLAGGRLVHHEPEIGHERSGLAAGTGIGQLPDSLDDAAPLSSRHGSTGPGAPEGDGGDRSKLSGDPRASRNAPWHGAKKTHNQGADRDCRGNSG